MSDNQQYQVTADELRQFIEQYESLEAEKKGLNDHQKELLKEAKGRGYDPKIMKKIVAMRKKDPQEISEEEAILHMYLEALGMEIPTTDEE